MRLPRILRVVIIPMAALSILIGSAVPASAATSKPATSVVAKPSKPAVQLFGMVW